MTPPPLPLGCRVMVIFHKYHEILLDAKEALPVRRGAGRGSCAGGAPHRLRRATPPQ